MPERLSLPQQRVVNIMREAGRPLSLGYIADRMYRRGLYSQRRAWLEPVLVALKAKGVVHTRRAKAGESPFPPRTVLYRLDKRWQGEVVGK